MAIRAAAQPLESATSATMTNKRRIIFPILAGLLALLGFVLLDGVREAIAPWSLHINYDPQPELNKWHYVGHGAAVGILFSGSMLALTWQPARKPLLLWMYVLGFATLAAIYGLAESDGVVGFFVTILVASSVLVAAYPDRRELLRLPRPGASRLLLALTGLAALGMTPAVARAFGHVFDKPAFEGAADPTRWGSDIIMSFVLIIGGLLVSSMRGGWFTLGVIVGLDFLYVGAAAITIPDQDGSWGTLGGMLSIVFGLIWFAALHQERKVTSAVKAN